MLELVKEHYWSLYVFAVGSVAVGATLTEIVVKEIVRGWRRG